jgi:membrane-bound metal-dependent hydrolase YbcI (DUF457 family)
MLDWKIHFIFGLLFFIALLSLFYLINFQLSLQGIIVTLIVSSFSSLFPDTDMQKSKIRSVVSFAIAVTISAIYIFNYSGTWYYAPIYFAVLYFIFKYLPTKHRGVAHTFKFSLLFSAIITAILYATLSIGAEEIALYFAVSLLGYNLHLVLDKI